MSVREIVHQIQRLSHDERHELADELEPEYPEIAKAIRHSIMKYVGIGKSLYVGRDAQEEINELRDEWNRPT